MKISDEFKAKVEDKSKRKFEYVSDQYCFIDGAHFAYEHAIRDVVKALSENNGKAFALDDSAIWYADWLLKHFGIEDEPKQEKKDERPMTSDGIYYEENK